MRIGSEANETWAGSGWVCVGFKREHETLSGSEYIHEMNDKIE